LRHYSCHSSAETIARTLTGIYRAEHLFALEQALALFALLGKDITAIDGLGAYLWLKLIAECSDDFSSWPSAKHFISWLGLAPSKRSLAATNAPLRRPGCGTSASSCRRRRLHRHRAWRLL
jgi:hypothetical protein